MNRKKSSVQGRFAYEGLDRVVHERARLSIMTSLATHREGLVFSELKQLCALTDGNLSRHLDVLKEAGIVEIWKGYEGRRPKTLVRLTRAGRERFTDYLAELERLVKDAQRAKESGSKAAVQRLAVDPA
ncbi:MAG TPA: transcriptional regulator [Vicinamibacteria bacterium]|jgi:DNA-binding MarR family transcriptional regulator